MNRILLILSLLCLTSCSSKIQLATPQFSGVRLESLEQISLIEKIKKRNNKIRNYKSLIKIKAKQKDNTSIFRQALIYKYPTKLRIETYPSNSFYLLNYLDINEKNYEFYDSERDKKYNGNYSKDLIRKFFNIDFELDELADILVGRIPLSWLDKSSVIHKSNNIIQLSIDSTYYLEISLNDHSILKIQKIINNEVVIEINYITTRLFEETLIPKDIEIVIPNESTIMNLSLKSYSNK